MFHDPWMLEALVRAFEAEGRGDAARGVRELAAEGIHPLAKRGWRLSAASAAALAPRMLGGAGAVMRAGDRTALGPTRAHQTVQVHLTTTCIVMLELWMPFATIACGGWPVRGPGSRSVALVPNAPFAGDLVSPEDFGVVVALGLDGEFPTWITFAP